ncbi:MAG TPA: HNH endonuclease signature motif containing protein [Candidatus Binatia bacterium]|nr:HNH endonuclease signature motif containing protein [Candidatus Binatia bacterium]
MNRLKRNAYNREYYLKNRDYWKKRYQNKRDEIRAKQKQYAATPQARALKQAYERRLERRLIKAKYTSEYQSRPHVQKKRGEQSRLLRRSPKGLESARIYNELRRGRKLKAEGSFTRKEWLTKRNSSEGKCPFCQKQVGVEKMTIDHIIPLSKGGSNYISNIRAICRSCNSAIGNRGYFYCVRNGKRMRVYC